MMTRTAQILPGTGWGTAAHSAGVEGARRAAVPIRDKRPRSIRPLARHFPVPGRI